MKLRHLALLGLLALAPSLLSAQTTPTNFVTSQVTCSSVAAVLVPARPSADHTATIEQTGTNPFYIGTATVTSSNGFLIPGTAGSSYTVAASTAIYCVTGSSTSVVTVVETW